MLSPSEILTNFFERRKKPEPQAEQWIGNIPNVGAVVREYKHAKADARPGVKGMREEIENAHTVYVRGGPGIGDWVMAMRYARILAKHKPDKEFKLRIHPAFENFPFFSVPKNCTFDFSSTYSTSTRDKDEMSLGFFFDVDLSSSMICDRLSKKHSDYSEHDIYGIVHLMELGVTPTDEELVRPTLDLPKELFEQTPVDVDFFIAPDAKEASVTDKSRSKKSFSLEQWEEVLAQVPTGSRVGILIGSTHGEYCEEVFQIATQKAKEKGCVIERIQTATLVDFVKQLLRAKTFIGMDSGTTHLAYEVALAARGQGRRIAIKEIFNEGAFRVGQYALRGMRDQVDVFVVKRDATHTTGITDLATLPIAQIVDRLFESTSDKKSLVRRRT